MKNVTTLILIIFLQTFIVKGQDTIYTYLDSKWEKASKKDYTYFRKTIKGKNNEWTVFDYYKDGTLQMQGQYKSKKLKEKTGKFIYYYQNGVRKIEVFYTNGLREDSCYGWHDNGNKDYVGSYLNNERDGEWIWFFKTGEISAKENYRQGQVMSFSFFNEDGSKAESEAISIMPKFNGEGDQALRNYIAAKLEYPKEARRKDISGKVIILFSVDEQGKVGDVQVKKSIHPLLDNEAVAVVESMPAWIPGKNHNRLIKVWYSVPVIFKLN